MSNIWSATKTDKGISNGQIYIKTLYLLKDNKDNILDKFEESYLTKSVSGDWPDNIINDRLEQLNNLDISTIPLGVPEPTPVDQPDQPTQDELDRRAFLTSRKLYLALKTEVAEGLLSTKQAEVDTALASMRLLYKIQYRETLNVYRV